MRQSPLYINQFCLTHTCGTAIFTLQQFLLFFPVRVRFDCVVIAKDSTSAPTRLKLDLKTMASQRLKTFLAVKIQPVPLS